MSRLWFLYLPITCLCLSLLAFSSFTRAPGDRTPTAYLDQNNLITRGMERELNQAFETLSQRLYPNGVLTGYGDFFNEDVLTAAGWAIGQPDANYRCYEASLNEWREAAIAHSWYSVFGFMPGQYDVVTRIPLAVEPKFSRQYPVTMLFLPLGEVDPSNSTIAVVDCGRRIVFVPEQRLLEQL